MLFHIGEQVGIRGWGESANRIVTGPFTLARRPINPYDQHMWEILEIPGATSESILVPWISGLCGAIGDPVPSEEEISSYKELLLSTIHDIYEEHTNQSAEPGTGPADWIRGFLGVRCSSI